MPGGQVPGGQVPGGQVPGGQVPGQTSASRTSARPDKLPRDKCHGRQVPPTFRQHQKRSGTCPPGHITVVCGYSWQKLQLSEVTVV